MRIIIVKCITLIVMLVPISSIHAQSTTYSTTYIDLGYLAIDGSVSCSNYESDITMAGVILDGYRNRFNLKSNEIDFSGCKIISDRCFINDVSLDTIIIPEGVEEICNEAFSICINLKKVKLSNMEEINSNMFADCTSLKKITIPATVNTIGNLAFMDCPSLKTIKINNPNVCIEDAAFQFGCDVKIVKAK